MERVEALSKATELLRDGVVEYSTDDLLVVADWLVTGEATLALKFNEQRSRNYQESQRSAGTDGVDSYRSWGKRDLR